MKKEGVGGKECMKSLTFYSLFTDRSILSIVQSPAVGLRKSALKTFKQEADRKLGYGWRFMVFVSLVEED